MKLFGHLSSFDVKILLLGNHLLLLLRLGLLGLAEGWLRLGLRQEVRATGDRNLLRVILTVRLLRFFLDLRHSEGRLLLLLLSGLACVCFILETKLVFWPS